MGKTISDVFVLEPAELAVLAAGKEIEGLLSLDGAVRKIDEDRICKAMNRLYQTGRIVSVEDGVYMPCSELNDILTIMREARFVVLIRNFTHGAAFKVLYIGGGIAATEQTAVERDVFRLYYVPADEVGDFLEGELTRQSKLYYPVLDEEEVLKKVMRVGKILEQEQADALVNALILVEMAERKTGRILRRFVTVQGQEQTCMYEYGPEDGMRMLEKDTQLKDRVLQAIREEMADDIS